MATTRIVIGEHVYIGLPESNGKAEAVADIVADMDHEQQAAFFNQLARRISEWSGPAGVQWLSVGEDLSDPAKALISDLADHISN